MKTLINYTVSAVVLMATATASAQGMNPSMMQQQGMPMSPNNMPMSDAQRYEMMMDPVMRENMMKMRQQRMAEGQYMPMMGQGNYGMMMDPTMRENMRQYSQQGNGMQGGMMNPQMMQNMMQMRQQHMNQIQQRLDKIESMLAELLEMQKGK